MSADPDIGTMLGEFRRERVRRRLLEVASGKLGIGWSDVPLLLALGLFGLVVWHGAASLNGLVVLLIMVLAWRLRSIDARIDALVELLASTERRAREQQRGDG